MTQLQVPLLPSQLKAAASLRDLMPNWCDTDGALHFLDISLPSFDLHSVLVKTAAINQLYNTRLLDIPAMARQIAGMQIPPPANTNPVTFVEALAVLPDPPVTGREVKYISFASKFAHFFVKPNLYPICDSYAEYMVKYHLGQSARRNPHETRYAAFVRGIHALQAASGVDATLADLDHYLWLAGQYVKWRSNPQAPINKEVAHLFADPFQDAKNALAALPPPSASAFQGEL
jgi:hypothetical protein